MSIQNTLNTTRNLFAALLILLALFGIGVTQISAANSRLGELDPTFNPVLLNSSVNNNKSYANAVLVQPDGKILYAGSFLSVERQARNYIARFNADGTLDSSFDSGGTVDGYINSMALQTDGKIIVAGKFSNVAGQPQQGIARLNADGSFDPTFRVGFTPNALIENVGITIQSDGKIVFTGNFGQIAGQTRNNFARVNTDGSLDTSFTAPTNCFGRRVAFQPDGKIIVNSSCGGNTGISRLNANGTLDSSFNPGTGANGSVVTVVLQSDGKILVGGQFTTFTGQTRNGFARLNANGSLDTAFNPSVPQFFNSSSIAIQSDGKILVARSLSGIGGTDKSVLRFNADGTTDSTFDAPADGTTYAIAAAPDGTIYAGGLLGTFQNFVFIQRPFLHFNSNGSIDFAFDPYVASPDDAAIISNAVAQPDGKILVRGQLVQVNRQPRRLLARVNADGSLDTSFTLAANVTISDGTHNDNALALQPDGKILVNGNTSGGGFNYPIRLNADGSLDASFTSPSVDLGVTKIALQADGKILVGGGFTSIGGQTRNGVARLNTNGSVDSFHPDFGGGNLFVSSLLVQPDGKILVTGTFSSVNGTPRNANVRFNNDGTLDSTFANTNLGAGSPYLAIQPDGKLIVEEGGYIVRVNADNTLDNGFSNVELRISTNVMGTVSTAAIQADGKILIGGSFNFLNQNFAQPRPNIARLNANGSVDNSYINYGGATGNTNASASGGSVIQISLQPDGKVLLAGIFKTFNNFGRFGVARLNQSAVQPNKFSDFDGDGKADLAVFRPSSGVWYLNRSTAGLTGIAFGLDTDKLVPADYDGDGKTDLAVYRNGSWYLQRSSLGFIGLTFGAATDIPIPADFDGDGKAELAVFRPSNGVWYFYNLATNQQNATAFGQSGDKPVPADYDGDGKADIAVYRDGIWYIQRSQLGLTGISFGDSNDKPVPADYDGDGKADVAVFRPSNGVWYLQRSQLGFTGVAYGLGTDIPVAADYDGDGKTDVAVFRNGIFYILQSATSQPTQQQFGAASDVPVAGVYGN